ncbi:MAG: hypothetical protein EA353_00610 [Puniceicoccaceae bacterium]|nr:MAG: hypothetical protein EA353_00610 [Puniceicoccaceae bacterium]
MPPLVMEVDVDVARLLAITTLVRVEELLPLLIPPDDEARFPVITALESVIVPLPIKIPPPPPEATLLDILTRIISKPDSEYTPPPPDAAFEITWTFSKVGWLLGPL